MLAPKRVKPPQDPQGPHARKGLTGAARSPSASTASKRSEPTWITNRQIESARVAMTRHIKRGGKVWIRIFPDKPITQKPAETRMGKGKGNPESWVAVVKPGRIMFELEGVPEEVAKRAMELAAAKLPIKCRFVVRDRQL